MNTYKRKVLTSAVLAGLGVAGSAHAIYQDPNGTGSFMLYPYYTVNSADGNSYNTYLTIVNPTSFTKWVRFRAREGRGSVEVRDFNIYLSPNDVWTAAIVPTDTGGARVITADTSCTMPVLPTISATTPPLKGVDFTNIIYGTGGGEFRAGIGTGLDRLREGYIEIIELATLDPAGPSAALTVHNPATDTPPCGAALLSATPATAPAVATEALPPTGGLNGTGTLLHVPTGRAMGYNAVALANWSEGLPQGTGPLIDELPNIGDSLPVSVTVAANVGSDPARLDGSPGTVVLYRSDWTNGFEAASATMMHTNVINEFVLENATKSNTDWVLTFPTRRGFVDPLGLAATLPPFTEKFAVTVGACEAVSFTFFNREERGQPVAAGGFSPGGAAAGGGGTVCWESTVLSIRNGASHTPASGATTSGVLGSVNVTGVDITPGIQAGWGNLMFTDTNAVTGGGLISAATSDTIILPQDAVTPFTAVLATPQTYLGLPVIGFAVWDRTNTAVTCGTAGCKFGELHNHKFFNFITPN